VEAVLDRPESKSSVRLRGHRDCALATREGSEEMTLQQPIWSAAKEKPSFFRRQV